MERVSPVAFYKEHGSFTVRWRGSVVFIKSRATNVLSSIAFILAAVCCSALAARAAGPSFVALPSMNHPLTFGTATTLTNGQVLITGGIDSSYNYLATAQL